MVQTSDEKGRELYLVAGKAFRIAQRDYAVYGILERNTVNDPTIDYAGTRYIFLALLVQLGQIYRSDLRVSSRCHDGASDRYPRKAYAADAYESFLDLDSGFLLGDRKRTPDALSDVLYIGHIAVAQAVTV